MNLRRIFASLLCLSAWTTLSHADHTDARGPEQGKAFMQLYPDAYWQSNADAPWGYLDWYPNPDGLSLKTHCEGQYQQPQVRFDDALGDKKQLPIHISAERSETEADLETRLSGAVTLRRGNTQVRAAEARIEHATRRASLDGLVQLREPNLLMLGDHARFDLNTGAAEVERAEFVLHDAQLRGDAESIARLPNGRVKIIDGRYTRCEPGNDSWTLQGSKILLRPDRGLGSIRHATLRLNNVPVLYLPYLSFPIDDERHSGLLPPRLSLSSSNGFDLTLPYYFNLAPHYDDTLTLRPIEKRGIQVENEFRYLHSIGEFTLKGSWLDNDRLYGDDRWLAGIEQKGSPAAGWLTLVDVSRVSDDRWFDDLNTYLSVNRDNHLQQFASLSYQQSALNFSLVAQDYQRIDSGVEEPYAKLPQLTLWGAPQLLHSDKLQLNYLSEFTRFDRNPADFSGNDRITGDRLHLLARLSAPINRSWGFLRPALSLSHTRYRLDNQLTGLDDEPTRTQPRFTLDGGLFFERPITFLDQDYNQTLEPRLFFVEAPFRDQSELPNFDSGEFTFGFNQLFRENRFSGYDRAGDTRQLTLGASSRLLTAQGSERLQFSAGQVIYFKDRLVRLDNSSTSLENHRSDIVLEGQWQLTDHFSISGDGRWDDAFDHNQVRNIKLAYRPDLDHQLSANYRFTADELEQLDLSAIWQLDGHWSLLARWLQDLRNAEPLDQIAGLEYENCCWQVRALYRHWINETATQRQNDGLFLQVTLKGLGGFGSQASGDSGSRARSFLKEIDGFEQREDS